MTPFVARRNADNNFTLLAVGTTRLTYQVGQNSVAFDDAGPRSIVLGAGETLVFGFLDANADGSSSGPLSVIPFERGGNNAEIWYSGGLSAQQSGSVTEGTAPTAGARVITNFKRDYRFNISLIVQ